jgi:hypothetical protein
MPFAMAPALIFFAKVATHHTHDFIGIFKQKGKGVQEIFIIGPLEQSPTAPLDRTHLHHLQLFGFLTQYTREIEFDLDPPVGCLFKGIFEKHHRFTAGMILGLGVGIFEQIFFCQRCSRAGNRDK